VLVTGGAGLEGDRDARVAEAPHRVPWRNAERLEQCGSGVPQVVKADLAQTGGLAEAFERPAQIARTNEQRKLAPNPSA
jgi:hypothetical protein